MNQIKLISKDTGTTTARGIYEVTYDGVTIGTITSWETYIWDIKSDYVSPLAASYRTRKGAVARLVADYNAKVQA